jgi:ArsR family transcriptional regulator
LKTLPLIDCCTPIAGETLSDRESEELERLFRTLGDRHRIKILNLLAQAGDAVCVCQLVPTLRLAQPTVSYHLKQLLEAGLLERERRGTFAYYRVVPGALDRVADLLGLRSPSLAVS